MRLSENRLLGNDYFISALLAFILIALIEGFGYKHPFGAFQFLVLHPGAFLVNYLILFFSLSLAWLFRRRTLVYVIVFVLWGAAGVTNGIVLSYRMTPFTTADLQILDLGIDMLTNYFTPTQSAVILGFVILSILLFLLLFFFGPKRRVKEGVTPLKRLRNGALSFVLSAVLLLGGWNVGLQTGAVSSYFENLWDAYKHYGMPYGFLSTWLRQGVSRPLSYSKQRIGAIFSDGSLATMTSDAAVKGGTADTGDKPADYPNIVFLQLESFIDPEDIKGMEFSDTPVPYFKELKETCSSGHLTVPVVGGGTANTEFEVMSGMSVREFGPGEYPFKTVLKEKTCESMAYDLRPLGYTSHAIHNHRGAFYNRNEVYRNLGFDDFTSLEYMNYVSKTAKNFARDDVLTGEILGALGSTEGRDYVFAISVQGHGEYPRMRVIKDPRVEVTSPMPDDARNMWGYYLEQIMEMDDFLRVLTEELSEYGEDVVLIIYGDHLPALQMTDDDMKTGTTFNPEYVIWSNFGLKKEDSDLYAYQLAAEVQRRVGLRQGTMTLLHQDQKNNSDYQDNLHLLMYDILYGRRYIYGEKNPFQPTDMHMGFMPIRIREIIEMGGEYYISGEGFTPFSKVTLDGKILDTIYIGPTVLKLLEKVDPVDEGRMKVSQVEKYRAILSTTE
jgi:phosphoglycerol transferase MdoB-like AlkP superfamily enzyme